MIPEYIRAFLDSGAAAPGLSASAPWLLAALAAGYLLGSVPFGVLLARAFGLGDLRRIGSGNIGATNVLRTGSKAAAAATLALDAAKGAAAVALMSRWGPDAAVLGGVGAVLGHMFPAWLRFRGGKGVATFLGVVLALHWPAGLAACGVWLGVAAATRYSSLAALVACASAPAWLWFWGRNEAVLMVAALAALVWARHHANIRRLLSGTESRIGGGG